MGTFREAIVRSVPESYSRCVRTSKEEIDVALAKKQHAEYCVALEKLGLKLISISADNALPDSCFVEDTAVVLGEKAIICNLRVASRAKETAEVARVLKKLKETHYIKPPATIDGGDLLAVEDTIFVGLTARTNREAVIQLRKIMADSNSQIIPVKVRNVLHLKSACTYLGNGYVILSEGHFDTSVLRNCEKIVAPKREKYAADCLSVNGTVLVAKGYPKTRKLIEKAGFPTEALDVSEFRKGDGALTCLSILF